VFRQTLFAEFEWLAHRQAEEGEALTADWLCDLYSRLLTDYYSPAVLIDDFMKWEWSRIPHFYNAYYVFKYANRILSRCRPQPTGAERRPASR
jgi:oligoendopeptidase F